MTPRFALKDSPDDLAAQAVTTCDVTTGNVVTLKHGTHSNHDGVRQFRPSVCRALKHGLWVLARPVLIGANQSFWFRFGPMPAALYGVAIVVLVGSHVEMRRIHTDSIIAVVTHQFTGWDFTVGQRVCHPMRVDIASRSGLAVTNADAPISVRHACAAPRPTFIVATAHDARPKADRDGLGSVRQRTILPLSSSVTDAPISVYVEG